MGAGTDIGMADLQFVVILALSPLFQGLIKKLKALMQGRRGPALFQTYYDLARLFRKEMVVSETASWVFRAAPYVVFSSAVAASMLLPVVTTAMSAASMGGIIALILVLSLGRFFMALAALDAGTSFGGEGSSREMTVAILVEPTMMLSLFMASAASGSTNIAAIAGAKGVAFVPSHILALSAFLVVVVAETGRIPVDNPDTHLELTMIHEGMLLEYSGRYLALMEWAHYIKQLVLFTLMADVFFPLGLSGSGGAAGLAASSGVYMFKMAFLCAAMAFIESTRAKMRFFQLPSLLGGAFVLSMLSLLSYVMLGR